MPATIAEANTARSQGVGKGLAELLKLVPALEPIPRDILYNEAGKAGITQREYRAALAEALSDSTPDANRLYRWSIYNPKARPGVAFARRKQPECESAEFIRGHNRQTA